MPSNRLAAYPSNKISIYVTSAQQYPPPRWCNIFFLINPAPTTTTTTVKNHVMAATGKDVEVRVMRADGLDRANVVNHLSDPYAKLTHLRGEVPVPPVQCEDGSNPSDKTSTCDNTLAPRWYQSFFLNDVQEKDVLRVEVIDENLIRNDIPLGSVNIVLEEALAHTEKILHFDTSAIPRNVAADVKDAEHLSPQYHSSHGSSCMVNLGSNDAAHTLPQRFGSTPHVAPATSSQSLCGRESNCPTFCVNASGLIEADAKLQNALARQYPLSRKGHIWIAIVDRTMVDGLSKTVVAQKYTQIVNNRIGHSMNIHQNTTLCDSAFGKRLFFVLDHVTNATKRIHPALNAAVLHPIQNALSEHPTWKVDMLYVDEIFGMKRQPWNKKHPAAQKIFSGLLSIPIRKCIAIQHSYLYAGFFKEFRHSLEKTEGHVLCGEDFVGITNGGIRNKKARMFTYVIMQANPPHPACLYFAETGAKFFQDMQSKHAMHSSAAKEVVYAGEFHFRKRQYPWEPPIRLVLDNNSGTYAPDAADLPKIRDLFERNFPGLPVQVLDFSDPLLEKYTRAVYRRPSKNDIDVNVDEVTSRDNSRRKG